MAIEMCLIKMLTLRLIIITIVGGLSVKPNIVNGQLPQDTFCPPQEVILPCRCSQRGEEIQIW